MLPRYLFLYYQDKDEGAESIGNTLTCYLGFKAEITGECQIAPGKRLSSIMAQTNYQLTTHLIGN
jgi:hypothetical protein